MNDRPSDWVAPRAERDAIKLSEINGRERSLNDSDEIAGGTGACELFTPDEFAGILKINKRTLWRKLSRGELPKPIYLGAKTPRWRAFDIHAWINGKETT